MRVQKELNRGTASEAHCATAIGCACRGVDAFDLGRESSKRRPRGHHAELVDAPSSVVVTDEHDSSAGIGRPLESPGQLHRVGARVACVENDDVGVARYDFRGFVVASDLGREASTLEEKTHGTSKGDVARAQEDADRLSGTGRRYRIDVGRGHAKRKPKPLRATASLDLRRGGSRCSASHARATSAVEGCAA